MIKQITSLLLFTTIHLLLWSQDKSGTNGSCVESMAQNSKGRWIHSTDLGTMRSKEVYNRLDQIQNMVLKIYPEPKGVDAVWHRSAGISYFGSKRKSPSSEATNLPHFSQFTYTAGFFAYRCDAYEKNVLRPGYPGETGTWLNIIANTSLGNTAADDYWTIDDLPVILLKPVLTRNPGYEILYREPGRNVSYVLVYRKEALPYIPVTRKKYLDYCILYHSGLWNEIIKGFEQMPVRSLEEQEKEKKAKLAKFEKDQGKDPKRQQAAIDYYLSGYKTDQQIKDDRVAKAKENQAQELKKFTDELEKTTAEGLLDSPAMVLIKYYSNPIFETDPVKGLRVVTENPAYIRKDLPKHAPQFFIVSCVWNDWLPQKKFAEIIDQHFPFEELQAMVDK